MKKVLLSLLLTLLVASPAIATDYDALWRKVSAAQRKDVPRQTLTALDAVIAAAGRGGDYGELLAARLCRMRTLCEISPDSLHSSLRALIAEARQTEALASADRDAAARAAVMWTVLARWAGESDGEISADTCHAHALSHPDVLASVAIKPYRRLVVDGTADAVFASDLLSLVGHEAGRYAFLREYYEAHDNRRAACAELYLEATNARGNTADDMAVTHRRQLLQKGMERYAGVPECALVAKAYYEMLQSDVDVSEATRYLFLKRAIERWGDSEYAAALRNAMGQLTLPRVELTVAGGRAVCELRNVHTLRLSFSPLGADGTLTLNPSRRADLHKLLRMVSGKATTLSRQYANASWQSHADTVPLPDMMRGVYLVTAEADTLTAYTLYYNSGLSLLTLTHGKKAVRLVAVNATDGRPVPGAAVTLTRETGRKSDVAQTVTLITNAKGEAVWNRAFEANRVRVTTATDRAFQTAWFSAYFDEDCHVERRTLLTVLTDRAIYRPGQTVRGVVVAHTAPAEDAMRPTVGKRVVLRMDNCDGQTLLRDTVTTDTLGHAAFEFAIPTDVKRGRCLVWASGDSTITAIAAVRVEDYKRPTFEVTATDAERYAKPIAVNTKPTADGLPAEGVAVTPEFVAKAYSGEVVQGAKVTYSVTRRRQWWRAWGREERTIVASATTVTGADGRFTVPLTLTLPEEARGTFAFVIRASVTDKRGETREVSLTVNAVPADTRRQECLRPQSQVKFFELTADRFPYDTKIVTLTVRDTVNVSHRAYFTLLAGERVVESGSCDFDTLLTRRFRYEPQYGEGLTICYAWLRDGIMHTFTRTVLRPIADTALHPVWRTFRDRTQPGSRETWTLTVPSRQWVAAVATIYDKSLDALARHQWSLTRPASYYHLLTSWKSHTARQASTATEAARRWLTERQFTVATLADLALPQRMYFGHATRGLGPMRLMAANAKMAVSDLAMPEAAMSERSTVAPFDDALSAEEPQEEPQDLTALMRSDFAETAFFAPSLVADAQGDIAMTFTLPETLTTWRLLMLTHDAEMRSAIVERECVAAKQVTVKPNVPRFLRRGDEAVLTATVRMTGGVGILAYDNEEMARRSGDLRPQLQRRSGDLCPQSQRRSGDLCPQSHRRQECLRPQTTARVTMQYLSAHADTVLWQHTESLALAADSTVSVAFAAPALATDCDTLLLRVAVTTANGASDGEQHAIAVLPQTERVVRTVAFTQHGPGTYSRDLADLVIPGSTSHRLTVAYTPRAEQMIADAVPTVVTPRSDDALSLSTAVYVQRLFAIADTAAVASRLSTMQLSDGSWPWWQGMRGSVWTTTATARLLARLAYRECGDSLTTAMLSRAMPYLLTALRREADDLRRLHAKNKKLTLRPSETAADILYVIALTRQKPSITTLTKADSRAADYLLGLMADAPAELTIYGKAHTAAILALNGRKAKAQEHLGSLLEYSVVTDEAGRYFDSPRAAYSWRNYRIPSVVAAIEALRIVAPTDTATVEQFQRWLLHEKRTQRWDTSLNTADAIYAFLGTGNAILADTTEFQPRLALDGHVIAMSGDKVLTATMPLSDAQRFTAEKSSRGTAWGALFVEQEAPLTAITAAGTGFTVRREIVGKQTGETGERVTVRLTITAERDYDCVTVADRRSASLEPVNGLSGYVAAMATGTARGSYSGCYREVTDTQTLFHFDRLAKGRHTIDTDYYIDRQGHYVAGTASVRCEYAPEFAAVTR